MNKSIDKGQEPRLEAIFEVRLHMTRHLLLWLEFPVIEVGNGKAAHCGSVDQRDASASYVKLKAQQHTTQGARKNPKDEPKVAEMASKEDESRLQQTQSDPKRLKEAQNQFTLLLDLLLTSLFAPSHACSIGLRSSPQTCPLLGSSSVSTKLSLPPSCSEKSRPCLRTRAASSLRLMN